jgi:hypothetical protein
MPRRIICTIASALTKSLPVAYNADQKGCEILRIENGLD